MKIEKYTAFFHDGAIRGIRHAQSKIELLMESAQILPEWNEDNIALSKRDTISGKLHLEGVKNVKEDDEFYLEKFRTKSTYDRAGIYDFEITSHTIFLLIWWVRYPPNREDSDIFKYEIEVEKMHWENIPTLFDAYWDSLFRKEN